MSAMPIAPPPGTVLATAVEACVLTSACEYRSPGVVVIRTKP